MNREEHLLTIVGEECSEVHQRCSKAARFGMNEVQKDQPHDNKERILQEFNDLVAAVEMLYGQSIDGLIDDREVEVKKRKIERYLNYAKSKCGTLT